MQTLVLWLLCAVCRPEWKAEPSYCSGSYALTPGGLPWQACGVGVLLLDSQVPVATLCGMCMTASVICVIVSVPKGKCGIGVAMLMLNSMGMWPSHGFQTRTERACVLCLWVPYTGRLRQTFRGYHSVTNLTYSPQCNLQRLPQCNLHSHVACVLLVLWTSQIPNTMSLHQPPLMTNDNVEDGLGTIGCVPSYARFGNAAHPSLASIL